jgi:Tellurite resistance protein TerB
MTTVDRFIEEWDRKAAQAVDGAEAEFKALWGRARATIKGEVSPDPNKVVTLEARPELVKVLYARVLAAQCLVDGRLDPREIQYLYVFMSRIGLGPDSREEVRGSLDAGEILSEDLVRMVEEVVSEVPDNEEEIAVSMIKDLVHVSRADGSVLSPEEESVRKVAEAQFGEKARQVVELAGKTVEYEQALIKGDVSASELERHVKEIAAVATAASVPTAALFFSGSVVGPISASAVRVC